MNKKEIHSPLVITKGWPYQTIAKEYKYKAFGEMKYESGTYYDNHKFTGKEEDGSGLYYFGARYYDKSIGRWISPDPASYPSDLRLNDPQSFNPYVYCRNNPIKYIDPDGRIWKDRSGTTIWTSTMAPKIEEAALDVIEGKETYIPYYYYSKPGVFTHDWPFISFGPKTKRRDEFRYTGRDWAYVSYLSYTASVNFLDSQLEIFRIKEISTEYKTGVPILQIQIGAGAQVGDKFYELILIRMTKPIDKLNEILKERNKRIIYNPKAEKYEIVPLDREEE